MSQLLCAKSGLLFSCQFMPVSLKAGEVQHPFFNVSRRSLLAQAGRWANGDMCPEETYLYYLALFDSSGLIVWRHNARFNPDTLALIAGSMENLIQVIGRMDVHDTHTKNLPKFTINYDTATLTSAPYWIEAWGEAITESISGYKTVDEIYEEQAREEALARLIKSPFRNSDNSLARKLATWAAQAGKFPEFLTPSPNGKHVPCTVLWQEIIRACVDDDRVIHIPGSDLDELIEHVIDNIPQGTIYAAKLLEFLRAARNKKIDVQSLGLENADLAGQTTSFQILRPGATTGQKTAAILNNIAARAPDKEPQRKDYPDLVSYIRARSAWTIAKSMPDSQINQTPMSAGVADELNDLIVDDTDDFPDLTQGD